MRHCLITRLRYDDDQAFYDRLQICKNLYMPCMIKQTVQNFDIIFITHDRHVDDLNRTLSPIKSKIITVNHVEKAKALSRKYEIQTRHDSDDTAVDHYIWKIQGLYNAQRFRQWNRFLINFKPLKHDLKTGIDYYHERNYNDRCISMFPTFCQRELGGTLLMGPHSVLAQRLKCPVYTVREGYVRNVVHGKNMTSQMDKTNKKWIKP